MAKKILMVDMDGVIADYLHPEYSKKFKDYKDEGFFRGLPEVDGMQDAISLLEKKYDIFFLTTAPWSSPRAWKEKREWVEDKFGERFKKKIIMTHRKDLVYGDYLIDDRTANGAKDFKGEFIHFATKKFPNWAAIVKYLL
tara:strand:+ start:306 stop:725 length:420 start_codon:yes stop_codon:yes gene_type:complete